MKNLFLPLMLFAVAVSSCSKDEPNTGDSAAATNNGDLLAINVYAGTTKATDTTTASLEESKTVVLHIDDSGVISATYTFAFADSDWSQSGNSIVWGDIKFPANFYSMHDGEALSSLNFTADVATYTNYTVTGTSVEHKDLVYHASTLNAIPTGGAVSVYHKHALSKIHLYAATGSNTVYIARVQMVNIDSEGTVTITPLSADELSTTKDIEWGNSESVYDTYQYLYIGDGEAVDFNSEISETNPIINDYDTAPFMIIPQTTSAAKVVSSEDSVATFSGSYIEVIYYMTDSDDMPLVGYSSVAARSDASEYIDDDQGKVLYVMAAFPLSYTFEANKEYDIALGLGVSGSTGGILVADYYVNQNGEAVTLTKDGVDIDEDGDSDEDDGTPVEIPEIDEGDYILADSDDAIDIVVSANSWGDGDYIEVEHSQADSDE